MTWIGTTYYRRSWVVTRGLGYGALGGTLTGIFLGLWVYLIGAIFGAPLGLWIGAMNGLVCGIVLALCGPDLAEHLVRARVIAGLTTAVGWLLVGWSIIDGRLHADPSTAGIWLFFTLVGVGDSVLLTRRVVLGKAESNARRALARRVTVVEQVGGPVATW